jgi:hypothetical protein
MLAVKICNPTYGHSYETCAKVEGETIPVLINLIIDKNGLVTTQTVYDISGDEPLLIEGEVELVKCEAIKLTIMPACFKNADNGVNRKGFLKISNGDIVNAERVFLDGSPVPAEYVFEEDCC